MNKYKMVAQTGGRRRKRTGKKRKASAAFMKAGNDWRGHIKETMRKNPSMKFGKALLKLASKTYKKGQRTLRDSKYSVRVRPNAGKKKTKRPKRPKRKSTFSF